MTHSVTRYAYTRSVLYVTTLHKLAETGQTYHFYFKIQNMFSLPILYKSSYLLGLNHILIRSSLNLTF
ncbi:hypothetical protein Hdeb2414_s0004g00144041 [Helianthus debilis subsp. tardiflorus]